MSMKTHVHHQSVLAGGLWLRGRAERGFSQAIGTAGRSCRAGGREKKKTKFEGIDDATTECNA